MKSKLKANKVNRREAKCIHRTDNTVDVAVSNKPRNTIPYDTCRRLNIIFSFALRLQYLYKDREFSKRRMLNIDRCCDTKKKPYYDVIEDEEKVKRFSVICLPDERRRRWFSHLYVVFMICDSGLDESIELVKVGS